MTLREFLSKRKFEVGLPFVTFLIVGVITGQEWWMVLWVFLVLLLTILFGWWVMR